jgi:hypothetical protein
MTPIPSQPALPPSLPSPSPSLLLILLTPPPPPRQVQTTTTKAATHNTPNIPPKTLGKNSQKILFATTKNLRSNFPTNTDRNFELARNPWKTDTEKRVKSAKP